MSPRDLDKRERWIDKQTDRHTDEQQINKLIRNISQINHCVFMTAEAIKAGSDII